MVNKKLAVVIVVVLLVASALMAYLSLIPSTPVTTTPSPTAPTTTPTTTPTTPSVQVPNPDTLIIAWWTEPGTVDPAWAYESFGEIIQNCYDFLVDYKPGTTELEPELAEKWEVSPDGLTYTFYLRKNVKFANGDPVNAEAVKYSLDRMLKINSAQAWMYTQCMDLNSVKVIDEYTVQIKLTRPYSPFIHTLAFLGAAVVNPNEVKAHEVNGDLGQDWLREHTAGAGPYVLKEWTHGQRVVLERNPYYWRSWSGNHVSKIIFLLAKDPATSRMMLENGEVDIAYGIPASQMRELEQNPDLKVVKTPTLMIQTVAFNNQKPPTDDVRIRKAISYAIDYQAIINEVAGGYAVQMQGPLPKGLWSHDDALPVYQRDLDRAKQLLAEAGYPEGGFTLEYYYMSTVEDDRKLGELLQAMLKEIGINVELRGYSSTAWIDLVLNMTTAPHLMSNGWMPDYADPDDYLYAMLHSSCWGANGWNIAYYKNEQVDSLLDQAQVEVDVSKRTSLYMQAQKLIVEDAPWIFLYQPMQLTPMRTWVHGYSAHPTLSTLFEIYPIYKA